MKQQYKIITTSVSIIAILAVGVMVGVFVSRQTQIPPQGPAIVSNGNSNGFPNPVALPQNVFDTVQTVMGTTVSVSYPKNGFYGFGTKISFPPITTISDFHSNPLGIIMIQAGENASKTSAPADLSVGVYGVEKGESLKGLVNNKLSNEAKNNGTFVTVNGHEYFVYKNFFGPINGSWVAVSVGTKELVNVSFSFDNASDAFSSTAFRNDDQLFLQILSHINFK
jgi:hypothetical protein